MSTSSNGRIGFWLLPLLFSLASPVGAATHPAHSAKAHAHKTAQTSHHKKAQQSSVAQARHAHKHKAAHAASRKAVRGQAAVTTAVVSGAFSTDVQDRLQRYQPLFVAAARRHDLDWRLLAAIGYQESRWNSSAKGAGNVSGVMMLTSGTARHLGVDNRHDANASISAGARYLRQLDAQLPESISEPDRTWMTLIAYNRGPGYLQALRQRVRNSGGNADRWASLSQYLQSHRRYRPVLNYVQSVNRYYSALAALPAGKRDIEPRLVSR